MSRPPSYGQHRQNNQNNSYQSWQQQQQQPQPNVYYDNDTMTNIHRVLRQNNNSNNNNNNNHNNNTNNNNNNSNNNNAYNNNNNNNKNMYNTLNTKNKEVKLEEDEPDNDTDWKTEYDRVSIAYQAASFEIFKLKKENKELQQTIQMLLQSSQQNSEQKTSSKVQQNVDDNDDDNKYDIFSSNLSNFDCMICLETKSAESQHILSCGHRFCRDCLRGHILNYGKPELPDCPLPDCDIQMADHVDIQILITEQEYREFHNKIDKIGISKLEDLVECLTPDCKYAVELTGGTKLDCPLCKKHWCTKCQIEWHHGMTCDDYKEELRQERIRNNVQQRDIEYNEWMRNQDGGVKQCPSCRNHVEKNEGCNHMTCRCGAHWCWICGVAIDGNNLEGHFSENHPMIV